MGLTLLTLVTLIILFILSQSVTVRVFGTAELRITVSLTLFALELRPKKQKKNQSRSDARRARILPELFRQLLPSTDVRVRSARFAEARIYASPWAMISGAIALPLLLVYVKRISGTFFNIEDSDEAIDISFIFPLTALFISLIKASYYMMKQRKERKTQNA